ncbi:MAG TPA: hypothetical protein VN931_03255 [Fibrobacteria bacterium]|nr:hypothetical protein [Fibrobacteria bacterium]
MDSIPTKVSLSRTKESLMGISLRLAAALLALSGTASTARGEEPYALTFSPSSAFDLLVIPLYYGKVSFEFGKKDQSSWVVQVSGTDLNRHDLLIDEQNDFSAGGETFDTTRRSFDRGQASIFLGRRFYLGWFFLQPTLSIGYASFEDHLDPNSSFHGPFSSLLLYGGVQLRDGFVLDLDIGGGRTLFGTQAWSFPSRSAWNLDANFALGHEF